MRDFATLRDAMQASEAVFLDARAQLRREYAEHAGDWLEREDMLEIEVAGVQYWLDWEDRQHLIPIIVDEVKVPADI